MKKAVIQTGGHQYVVAEGDKLNVEKIKEPGKSVTFTPLLVIEDDKTTVGTPEVSTAKVTAEILEPEFKAEKVTAIRYKAKKRVHKVHGHRQVLTALKITKIA